MAWNLYSSRDFNLESKNTPTKIGPGTYQIDREFSQNPKPMSAPFGSSKVDKIRLVYEQNLAPGAYESKPLEKPHDAGSVLKSRTQRRLFKKPPPGPTPTQYSNQDDWTMTNKFQAKRVKLAPHPERLPSAFVGQSNVAAYQTDEEGNVIPVIFHPKTSCDIGPGTYTPNEAKDRRLPHYFSQQESIELFKNPNEVPGPGSYPIYERNTRLPTSILEKHPEKPPEFSSPIFEGPKIWTTFSNETNAVFKNRETREIFSSPEKIPECTQYSPQYPTKQTLGDLSSFGVKSERKGLYNSPDTPGPGEYNIEYKNSWIKNSKSKSKTTFRHEIQSNTLNYDDTPGPGTYNGIISHSLNRPSSAFKSKSIRNKNVNSDVPGPGNYSPDKPHVLKSPKIHNSRTEKHDDWIKDSINPAPAPDSYQSIDSNFRNGKTISRLGNRFQWVKKNKNPGPGTYDVSRQNLYKQSHNSSIPYLS